MKLLMTADAVGGVWQYSLDLARGLARNGVDILLACMGPRPSDSQREEASAIPHLELIESDYALEWMQNPWADVERATGWLQSVVQRNQVHLVHLNGYSYAAADWNCPVLVVAHSCVYSWWRAVHATAPGPDWSEYKFKVSAGLAACNCVVAPTRAMARSILDEYQVSPTKLRVIHNFSRAPRFEAGAKLPRCLAAGRFWDQAKNLQVLNTAATRSPWPIQVAGPSQDPQTGTTAESPLQLLGTLPHDELLFHMSSASIFVHPALYEPFGLSVLEAARSRCCLLLSNIPPLRELWEHAAIFVDPRDPGAWTHELNRLASRKSLLDHFAQAAFERSSRYSAFQGITEYLQLYEMLLSSNRIPNGVAA